MRAMTSLNVSGNDLRSDGAKALAHALQKNNTLTELNVASNNLYHPDFSGVIALADVIKDMGPYYPRGRGYPRWDKGYILMSEALTRI
jgi:hypothetical protein